MTQIDYRALGAKGGLATAIKFALEPAKQTEKARAAYASKLAARIDPTGELQRTNPAKFAHLYQQLRSQIARENGAKGGRKNPNKAILQIVQPKAGCVYCYTERNRRMPKNYSHRTCANHAQRSAGELSQLSIRASHLNGEA